MPVPEIADKEETFALFVGYVTTELGPVLSNKNVKPAPGVSGYSPNQWL